MSHFYSFQNDYSEGAHPQILATLNQLNLKQESGYGEDTFSKESAKLIKKLIEKPEAAVHFVCGGTQANLISLSSMLKPYEAVIAVESGHIAVHETGAVEATGHKVITVSGTHGKITPEAIQQVLIAHDNEHMVHPRVVYISQTTELGNIYTKQELQTLYTLCHAKGLYLFIDGARLGSALMSKDADFHLKDIAELSDIFTIGGTKNGAFLGEAIVIVNRLFQEKFRYHVKQHGALLAKGAFLGIQFKEFFESSLYLDNAAHANKLALKFAKAIEDLGYKLLYSANSNQIFPILPNNVIEKLQKNYRFYIWSPFPEKKDHSVIRLVTSWATKENAVEQFLEDLSRI